MPSIEYINKKKQEERRQLVLEEQERLDAQLQEMTNDWLVDMYPGIERVEKQPAIVELAGFIRKLAFGKLMLPAGLSEQQQKDLLKYLYEEVDGTHFEHMDPDYWQEGTHSLEYLEDTNE